MAATKQKAWRRCQNCSGGKDLPDLKDPKKRRKCPTCKGEGVVPVPG